MSWNSQEYRLGELVWKTGLVFFFQKIRHSPWVVESGGGRLVAFVLIGRLVPISSKNTAPSAGKTRAPRSAWTGVRPSQPWPGIPRVEQPSPSLFFARDPGNSAVSRCPFSLLPTLHPPTDRPWELLPSCAALSSCFAFALGTEYSDRSILYFPVLCSLARPCDGLSPQPRGNGCQRDNLALGDHQARCRQCGAPTRVCRRLCLQRERLEHSCDPRGPRRRL